jgi:hypothetical protein
MNECFRPRRSSKRRSRSQLNEAGPRVHLHGAEALTQKSRGGQSPRGHYAVLSGACAVRLDLHLFINIFGMKRLVEWTSLLPRLHLVVDP